MEKGAGLEMGTDHLEERKLGIKEVCRVGASLDINWAY